ncbi:MAG: aspartyl protease family protein [Gammaproteobacteria bacterium]
MGRVMASVRVENKYGPAPMPPVMINALVDTGASHLVLPGAWRDKFGVFAEERDDETETATQDRAQVTLCGPARVRIDGFSEAHTDVLFLDMKPDRDGAYMPLLGYTVLEMCKAAVDLSSHRLIPVRAFDLRRASTSGGA